MNEIPDKLYFTIGEAARLAEVRPHVLRFWEQEFPRLAPRKDEAGRRIYRRQDVETILRIRHLLYDKKFTIAGARKVLLGAEPEPPPTEDRTESLRRDLKLVLSLLKTAD